MNNKEYDKLTKEIVVEDDIFKNMVISFFSGGILGLIGQLIADLLLNIFNCSIGDSYLLVFIIYIIIGSLLTGIGVFDKVLSIFKCGLIVPSTGFANSMTSSAMDTRNEGFVRGIGSSIFKLTWSIILYGIVFGIIFGFVRGIILWHIFLIKFL